MSQGLAAARAGGSGHTGTVQLPWRSVSWKNTLRNTGRPGRRRRPPCWGPGPGGGPPAAWPHRAGLVCCVESSPPRLCFAILESPTVGTAAVENSLAIPQKTKESLHTPAAPRLGTRGKDRNRSSTKLCARAWQHPSARSTGGNDPRPSEGHRRDVAPRHGVVFTLENIRNGVVGRGVDGISKQGAQWKERTKGPCCQIPS